MTSRRRNSPSLTLRTAIDAAYPNGNYALIINAVNDGTKSNLLSVTGNTYPVTTPHISNFTAAQAIDPCVDFVLTWDAFSGGTTNDYVQLEIAPKRGNAVFFSYERAHPSTRTLHGGAPVLAGEKWIATKWLRARRFE